MKYQWMFLFLLIYNSSFAGEDKIVIHFVDKTTGMPLKNVSIIDKNGSQISQGDTMGYAVLSFPLPESSYLIALCPGYKPDTISTSSGTVYMQPLTVSLTETIVRSGPVNKLLHAPNEYVVDYAFLSDNVLVATYSGNEGGHAKLFLVNQNGDVLTTSKLPCEPLSLYKSCVGNYYCICRDKFFPLRVSDTGITLLKPYDIRLLHGLQECELSINGNLYYKLTDRTNFRIEYGMIKRGDTVFRLFTRFEEKNVAVASYDEWIDVLILLEQGEFNEAAKKQLLRLKWDKGSFANINMPLLSKNDTLVIFDYFKKQLLLYDSSGDAVVSTPVQFSWKESQQFQVLKDEIGNKLYVHRYDKPDVQTIEELNINTGKTLQNKVAVSKPYAEQVKISNGSIYFLWQDKSAHATRQLFIQRAQ